MIYTVREKCPSFSENTCKKRIHYDIVKQTEALGVIIKGTPCPFEQGSKCDVNGNVDLYYHGGILSGKTVYRQKDGELEKVEEPWKLRILYLPETTLKQS